MISSMLAPTSRFSKTVATGMRVSLNTHAPLRLPGTLSTAGHCDQSKLAIFASLFQGTGKSSLKAMRDTSLYGASQKASDFSAVHTPGLDMLSSEHENEPASSRQRRAWQRRPPVRPIGNGAR